MSALISRGVEAPSVAGGGGGGSGPSGFVVHFLMYDEDTGELANVADFSTATIKISTSGADFTTAVGADPTNIAGGPDGSHYYIVDNAELPSPGGFVVLSVELAGYQPVRQFKEYGIATSTNVTTSTTTTAANITAAISAINGSIITAVADLETFIDAAIVSAEDIDAVLTASHGAGSWAGATAAEVLLAILDHNHDTGVTVGGLLARIEAVLTGKATGLNGPHGKYYLRDGVTVAVEADHDPDAGTRGNSTVTGSEP